MRRRLLYAVLVFGLVIVAGAGVFAQRGGAFGGLFRGSYSSNTKYDGKFTFIRMSYQGDRRNSWSHDYPVGEEHFMSILTNVSNVNAHVKESNILSFNDPEMFKFPVIYLVEPGYWRMAEDDVVALRSYLLKGGFMIVDDFPQWAWGNFEVEMSRVFPQGKWIDLDISHPIFHSFFEIPSLTLAPAYPNLGPECLYRAMFEDNDPTKRMYVMANFQNDISEYWEKSDSGYYIVSESNEAYKYGVNEFIYGITH